MRALAAASFLAVAAAGCAHRPPSRPSAFDHVVSIEHDPILDDPAVVAAASRVRVTPDELPCPAEVVGVVDVHEPVADVAAGLELLRRRAALLRADAVTDVELEHGEGGGAPTHLSGTAVRCNDLLKGKTYEVLGEVSVTAEMEHEDEGFEQLKARGRAKGGELLIDVRFEHGDGDRTTLRGTVVRALPPM